MTHIDDTNQTWPRTPLVLLGLEWFGFGSVTSVLLPMQQLRPQPLPLSIGAQASQECPEKSRKYHCQYYHNKSWEINVDEDGIQTYGPTSQFPVTPHLHRLQIHISDWNHPRILNLKKNDITKSCYMFSKKRHIPSTYNFINNFPLLNVNGFIQLWSQTFQQPHPGNRFLA